MARHSLVLCVALVVLALARGAAAQETTLDADALFARAQADEEAGAYPRALAEYRDVVARFPASRWTPRASARADYLAARAEGDFAPLARLDRVRRDPAAANDPAVIEALARDLEGFPQGVVRVEARMFVAEAYDRRLGRRDDAIRELRAALREPAIDPLTARLAAREIVDARVASGDVDGAVADARALGAELDPRYAAGVERLVARRALRRASFVALGLLPILAAFAIARAVRRGEGRAVARALRAGAPAAVALALVVGAAGGLLAHEYESGNAAPFVALGAALLPIALVARAWGAAGSPRVSARVARALACATCTFAAAFLLLDRIDAAYLEGFGL